jgi:hypothetical protein
MLSTRECGDRQEGRGLVEPPPASGLARRLPIFTTSFSGT